MRLTVMSFGFKHGLPIEADLVFDVRFMPNPFYVAELKHQTGLDRPVQDFVFSFDQTHEFMSQLEKMISFLLPLYSEEGKSVLVIAIGCTVTVEDARGNEMTCRIVGSQEADPMHRAISEESPFGKALMGAKEGDEISVEAPVGIIHYRVEKIER